MRLIALCGLAGCGAAVYFPEEPPLPDPSARPAPPDTGEAPDTGEPLVLPCTGYGAFPSEMTVHNVGDQPLDLFYRDITCTEHLYATLAAGVTALQGTYDQNAWVVRDGAGTAVGAILVDEPYELWEVP